jgi:hypothetical protein
MSGKVHKAAVTKLKKRPPSTFGRDDNEVIDKTRVDSPIRNISKLNTLDQRNLSKKYMAQKYKEIKVKFQS